MIERLKMPQNNDSIETLLKNAIINTRPPYCKWVLEKRKDDPDLFYLDFLETKAGNTEALENEVFKEAEEHIGQCDYCQRHISRAAVVMAQAANIEKGATSQTGLRELEEKDLNRDGKEKIIKLKRTRGKDDPGGRMYLLAASSDQRAVGSKIPPGLAYGVAVSKEEQRGRSIVEIITDLSKGKGELRIDLFEQLEGFEVGGQMQRVTSKKAMLEDHLQSVLKTSPFFKRHNVGRKNISLRLNLLSKEGVISDIDSLELACLVSIASCLCQKRLRPDTAFTGRVLKSGTIAWVGDVNKKIDFLQECEFKDVYVPKENETESSAIRYSFSIHPVGKIDELFKALGLKAPSGLWNIFAYLSLILGTAFFLLQLIRWLG